MKFQPHDYQRYCISRMLTEPRLGLFLNMGLGKTVITLTALNEMLYYRESAKEILIIAPKYVAETTWTQEAKKWEHLKHLKIVKILGNKNQRVKAVNTPSHIYIINWENLAWLVDNFKWRWDTVIIDELSRFKNRNAKCFKKLKSVLPHIKRLYGLTGTPAANGFEDLWAQVYLIDRGERLEKTISAYREKYFKVDRYFGQYARTYKLVDGAEEKIRDKIKDICISLQESDYVKLPEKIESNVLIELSAKELKQYRKMERDMILSLPEGEIVASSAAVVTNKLLQIASGCVYDENGATHIIHNRKIEVFKEILKDCENDSVLVFYNFKHEKDQILKAVPEARVLNSDEDIRAWNNKEIKVLLAHPASAGYGLNMQNGGHIIIWFSPTWNLELYEQANARLLRQGQREPVVIKHLIAKDTMDSVVMKALRSKDRAQSTLLESLQEKLKEFSE